MFIRFNTGLSQQERHLWSPRALSWRGSLRYLQEVEDLGPEDLRRRTSLLRAQEGRDDSPSALQDNVRIYHGPILALPRLPRIKHQTIPFVYLS